MNNNELYHWGVKGMKWGVRKARPTTNASKVASKKASYDEAKNKYLSAKTDKNAKKAYKQAKKDYRTELAKDNENYKPNFVDKYVFNESTAKQINKYLNKGTTLKEARTKTYVSAGVNTAAVLLAAYGASKIGDKLVSKFM